MAKFKIQAGAEIDVVTHKEMTDALGHASTAWIQDLARGDRFRSIQGRTTIAATAVAVGGDTDQQNSLGPSQGFVWSVRRLAIIAGTAADVALLGLYRNSTGPGDTIIPVGSLTAYRGFETNEVVLYPGDKLLLSGTGLAGTGQVVLTGQVRELPVSLAWRL